MESGIFNVCCCFSSHCPFTSPYQELDDSGIKVKGSTDRLNEGNSKVGDYKTLESPLLTDSSNEAMDESSIQDEDDTDSRSGKVKERNESRTSVYTVQSEVLVQRSSWQTASFAMAQASRPTTNLTVGLEGSSRSRKHSGVSRRMSTKKRSKKVSGIQVKSANIAIITADTKKKDVTTLEDKNVNQNVISQKGSQFNSDGKENKELTMSSIPPFQSLLGVFHRDEQDMEEKDKIKITQKTTADASNDSLDESDREDTTSCSIATSDISTDPSSDEEETNQQGQLNNTGNSAVKQTVQREKSFSKNPVKDGAINRYQKRKPDKGLSSSIPTDELSDTSSNEQDTAQRKNAPTQKKSDKSKIYDIPQKSDDRKDLSDTIKAESSQDSGVRNWLGNLKLTDGPDEKELHQSYEEFGLNEMSSPEDADQFEIDSNDSDLSFAERVSEESPEYGGKELKKPLHGPHEKNWASRNNIPVLNQELRNASPNLSCVDGSTVIGSCVTDASSGGDTITPEMSVSRAGQRNEEPGKKESGEEEPGNKEPGLEESGEEKQRVEEVVVVEEVKKKHGIVSKFKKKVWKK